MKITPRKRWFLCSLILILLFTSVPVWAGEVGVVNTVTVNVRRGPGTSYGVLKQVKAGQEFGILDRSGNWLKVDISNGQAGWIHKDLVTVKTIPAKKELMITAKVLNVRKGPGTNYGLVTKIGLNEKHTIVDEKNGWYKILVGKLQGWVSDNYVKVLQASAQSPVTPPAGTQTPSTPAGGIPSRGDSATEVLIVPIADGKIFKVVDKSGRPSIILEGWEPSQYQIKGGSDNNLTIELSGPTTRNYEGKITNLGILGIKVYPQNDKVMIEMQFSFKPGVETVYDNNSKKAALTVTQILTKGLAGKTIVVDPGHASVQSGGWSDPGAIGPRTQLYEKDANLDMSVKLKSLLEQAGARVILTRTGDTELSLAGRADVANSIKADIFVSIHCNSNDKLALSGHTVYFYGPQEDPVLGSQRYLRQRLASLVEREMVNAAGRKDNGVIEYDYAVLRYTTVPSILVETSYLSDREEEVLLGTGSFRQTIAQGIFNGIKTYFE